MTNFKHNKLLLKLHQPKKWEKHNYYTDKDYEEMESIIYNDRNTLFREKMAEKEATYNTSWIEQLLILDEAYDVCFTDPKYYITTFGRVFSSSRKKQLSALSVGNKISFGISKGTIHLDKEFAEIGWVYSNAFILDKYKQNKWAISYGYQTKK